MGTALLLAGCSSPPETKYYTLRTSEVLHLPSPNAGTLLSSNAKGPVVLVDHFAIDEAYASERLAYRQSDHELNYDPYSLWAGPPAAQIEDAVRDLLCQSGIFADVRQPAPLASGKNGADVIVTGRIARLEEIDKDEQWSAALDVELYLVDAKTHDVIAAKRYAASEPSPKRNPRDVVATLASLLEKGVKEFLVEARPALDARKPRGS